MIRKERQVDVFHWSAQQAEGELRAIAIEAEKRLSELETACADAERDLRDFVRARTQELVNDLRVLPEEDIHDWEFRRGLFRDIDEVLKDRVEAEELSAMDVMMEGDRMKMEEFMGGNPTGNPLLEHELHDYIYLSSRANRKLLADLCLRKFDDERDRLKAQGSVMEEFESLAISKVVSAHKAEGSEPGDLFEKLYGLQRSFFTAIQEIDSFSLSVPKVYEPYVKVTFVGNTDRVYEESTWLTHLSKSKREAVAIEELDRRFWWLYKEEFYSSSEELEPEEVVALIKGQESQKRTKIARAKAVAAMSDDSDPGTQRKVIPREVKILVWQRDQGKCVQCDRKENLEFDHIIPYSLGGADTERNLQLLCANCNREKGASL